MPKPSELLRTTALVPVALAPYRTSQQVIDKMHELVKAGDIAEAINFCTLYCFASRFAAKPFQMKRYFLKRLWEYLDEFYIEQRECWIWEQISLPGNHMTASLETVKAVEDALLADMRRSHGFERLLGRCEALYLMMYEHEHLFTPEGFELLAEKLTQSKDGA